MIGWNKPLNHKQIDTSSVQNAHIKQNFYTRNLLEQHFTLTTFEINEKECAFLCFSS